MIIMGRNMRLHAVILAMVVRMRLRRGTV